MDETTKYFVGVDLHKTILQVCVLDHDGEVIEERRFRGGSLRVVLPAPLEPKTVTISPAWTLRLMPRMAMIGP